MADLYADIPELSAESQAIARRRKIAEAMMQQGQAPLESMGKAGGAPIPISWTQGLAKMMQAYVGGKQISDTEAADKALADRHTGMETDAVSKVRDAMLGTPEKQAPFQADNPFGEDLGTNTTVMSAVAPGGRDAVQAALLESKLPGFRTAGQQMMLKQTEQQGQMQQIQDILKGTQAPTSPTAPAPQGSTVDFRGNVSQAVSEMNRISDPALRADAQAAFASQGAPAAPTTPPVFKSGGLTEEQAIALSSMVGNPAAVTLGKTTLAGIEKQRAEYNRSQDRALERQETFANQNFMREENAKDRSAARAEQRDFKMAMEQQRQGKPLTPQQQVKFEKQISDSATSLQSTISTMDQIAGAVANVRASKGLGARTGYSGYIPEWAQGAEAMTAENRINTLKGKVTQMGKAMATMSGAIGPMAVQEWKIVSDAVNAIGPEAGNFDEQLQNVLDQAVGAKTRIADAYDRQYSDYYEKYPQYSLDKVATPAAPAKPAERLKFDANGNQVP